MKMTSTERTRLWREEQKQLRKDSKNKKRVPVSPTTYEELKFVIDMINKEDETNGD